jgi:hypothetical protein
MSPVNAVERLEDRLSAALPRSSPLAATLAPSPSHRYLLHPFSATVRAVLNPRSLSIPIATFSVTADEAKFALEQNQYAEILTAIESIRSFYRRLRYVHLRPDTSARGHAKEWWRTMSLIKTSVTIARYYFALLVLTVAAGYLTGAVVGEVRRLRETWTLHNLRRRRKERELYISCTSLSLSLSLCVC